MAGVDAVGGHQLRGRGRAAVDLGHRRDDHGDDAVALGLQGHRGEAPDIVLLRIGVRAHPVAGMVLGIPHRVVAAGFLVVGAELDQQVVAGLAALHDLVPAAAEAEALDGHAALGVVRHDHAAVEPAGQVLPPGAAALLVGDGGVADHEHGHDIVGGRLDLHGADRRGAVMELQRQLVVPGEGLDLARDVVQLAGIELDLIALGELRRPDIHVEGDGPDLALARLEALDVQAADLGLDRRAGRALGIPQRQRHLIVALREPDREAERVRRGHEVAGQRRALLADDELRLGAGLESVAALRVVEYGGADGGVAIRGGGGSEIKPAGLRLRCQGQREGCQGKKQ